MPTSIPAARTTNLVVTTTADEILVYDLASHHLHHLNKVAATVWQLCNGQRSLGDLVADSGLPEKTVSAALGKLAGANLLDGDLATTAPASNRSRRALLHLAMIGGAAAVPVVVSITAPSATAQVSGCVSSELCWQYPAGTPCWAFRPENCATAICQGSVCSAEPLPSPTPTSPICVSNCWGQPIGTRCWVRDESNCAWAICQNSPTGPGLVCAAPPPVTPTQGT